MVAVSLTAHGFGIWSMLTSFVTNREALSFISEWAAPDLLSVATFPYVLMIAAVIVATARSRIEARELWVVIPFLVFGFTSARAIMPAAIVLAPFAASVWRRGPVEEGRSGGSARVQPVYRCSADSAPAPRGWSDSRDSTKTRFPVAGGGLSRVPDTCGTMTPPVVT